MSTHQAWIDSKSKFITCKTLSSISVSIAFYLSPKSSPLDDSTSVILVLIPKLSSMLVNVLLVNSPPLYMPRACLVIRIHICWFCKCI